MASHTHNGLTYEPLGIELHEVSRAKYDNRPDSETSRAPSYVSGLTGYSHVDDDDERSLIPHQESSTPEYRSDKVPKESEVSSPSLRKRRYRFKSWKVGVTTAAVMTTAVLLVNFLLTVWASVKFGLDGGIGTVYEGACSTVSAWSFWLHILINGLSSMLLSASNYTMQCVTAPTRRECDRAHSRGDWLDVGVPSVRNLFRISWQRRTMWALLAFSSTPIHLLYNSAVFKTLDDNNYSRLLVGRSFLETDYHQPSVKAIMNEMSVSNYSATTFSTLISNMHEAYLNSSFTNISTDECISTYATYYLSGHSDLLLIADDTNDEILPVRPSDYTSGSWEVPFGWMCEKGSDSCNNPADARRLRTKEDWTLNGTKIDYCLSQTQEEHCKLQFSIGIMVAVLLCNLIKCTTMFWVVWQQRDTTFITFGDAIVSWLEEPDPASANRCFESVRSISQKTKKQPPKTPQTIGRATRRWMIGVSRRRWITTILLLTIATSASSACLHLTIRQMEGYTADTIVSLGFGAVNSNMLLYIGLPRRGASGLASSVLFANLPQITLSFVYLSYNALITCMLLANEYSGYEVHRKALRVTTPCGQQRSTYWLQLPYTYGLPVMTASATLHWLISQSIFLVRVDAYSDGVLDDDDSVSEVGLSPAPMLVIVILGVCITAIAIGLGFRKLGGNAMPVAASCSLALAAAAHRPSGDVDAALLPVKWGEVGEMGTDEVGHCCFTSQEVLGVKPGRKYAGAVKQD